MFVPFLSVLFQHQAQFANRSASDWTGCGICGDPYDAKDPKEHEAGGRYATGHISEHYQQGQVSLRVWPH